MARVTFKLVGLDQVRTNLESVLRKLEAQNEEVLADHGEVVLERARELVPVRTGRLRDSGIVIRIERSAEGPRERVGFDTPSIDAGIRPDMAANRVNLPKRAGDSPPNVIRMEPTRPLRAAILGATGAVGQRFIELLSSHPWFEIACLAASERSSGRVYSETCSWRLPSRLPERVAGETVVGVEPHEGIDVAFSALADDAAIDVEPAWARAGVPVFSNARSFRMEPDVPLLIPEVNPDHLELVRHQRERRGFPESGFIVTNANCSATLLAMAMAPLERAFGVETLSVVTLQAISGAGYPGLPAMDILGNVIPFIAGEEAKLESETKKILGRLEGGSVKPAPMTVSAQVNRVPVFDGHTEAVFFELGRATFLEEIHEALASFRGEPQDLALPSAPERPIVVLSDEDRPQPALDAYSQRGMATVVGRLRPCPVLGYKMTVLGHNTIRGAAGGSILNAELAIARGVLRERA